MQFKWDIEFNNGCERCCIFSISHEHTLYFGLVALERSTFSRILGYASISGEDKICFLKLLVLVPSTSFVFIAFLWSLVVDVGGNSRDNSLVKELNIFNKFSVITSKYKERSLRISIRRYWPLLDAKCTRNRLWQREYTCIHVLNQI